MRFSIGSNSKILAINSIASVAIKIGAILVALFTTPAYITYFDNNEILRTWFTILSILTWMLYCDMGIGNGLRNSLVYAISKGEKAKIQELVSSAYFFLIIVASIVMLLAIFLGSIVNWNSIFNISELIISKGTFDTTINILIAAIILQFILRLVTSILYALQKSFIPGLLSLVTNILMLLSVLFLNHYNKNNDIIQLAWIYLISVNLPLIIATFWVFLHELKECRPRLNLYSMSYAKSLLSMGVAFLWLQLMSLLLDNTNSYLISLLVSNPAVVEYQIYYKVFSLPGTMVLLVSTVIWSIITKAKAEKNYDWLRKSYYAFMLFCFIITVFEFLLIPILQILFDFWLGADSISVNYTYAVVFAISGSIMAYRIFLCTYSNGMCELKNQIIWLSVGAFANVPLAYILSQVVCDLTSIMIANIICMLPYCVADTISFCKILQKKNCLKFVK